ncbi:MAG: sugar kinase [Mycobacteriales bacterium]
MSRVIVVGDLVTDVLVRTTGPLSQGSDTMAAIVQRGGGAGANTACWLAECGVDVALIARVGGDEVGRARILELFGANVEAIVAVDHDAATGTVVVLVDADGERTMLSDRAASLRLSVEDIDARVFEPRAHLHLSGYVLLDEHSRGAALYALERARDHGMTVSVDAASAAPLAAAGPEAFMLWTAGADLLLANTAEARVLTGCADAMSAATTLAASYRIAVVKDGAAGAFWASGEDLRHCPAEPAHVLDTTGAGDAFAAGLLSDWLAPGSTPDSALVAGSSIAATAVSVPGGRPIAR